MNVVILAAGLGKRMRSDLPKVLHPLAGRPRPAHAGDRARSLAPRRIVVGYGHGGETVPQAIEGDDLRWALQQPQRGTGHAVMQALPHLDPAVPTLVLYGDVPMTSRDTLARLLEAAGGDKLGLLTVDLPDPAGYGRIVRDGNRIVRIVEHKDADAATRAIREVNTGILVAPTAALARWLGALSDDNAQKEYYLTDVVAAAVDDGVPVVSAQPSEVWETLGVNSKRQLAELERIFQARLAATLMDDGVWLADPARLDVRGELVCGRDVAIDVNCVFEGKVVLEDGASIGANCVIRDTRVGAGAQVLPFTYVENASIGARARVGPYARLRPGTELGEDTHVGNFVEM